VPPATAAATQSTALPPAPPPAPAELLTSPIAPDLPPLPGNISMGARPPETIRTAYEFAARHPEVLRYMPCFCGCERMGHEGNEDCFVASRDKKGKVTAWVTHGMICDVCLDVAQQAMQMHNSGASLAAIRAAIEKTHADHTYHTPTPMPPKGKSGT
jgi:hypothetical protein